MPNLDGINFKTICFLWYCRWWKQWQMETSLQSFVIFFLSFYLFDFVMRVLGKICNVYLRLNNVKHCAIISLIFYNIIQKNIWQIVYICFVLCQGKKLNSLLEYTVCLCLLLLFIIIVCINMGYSLNVASVFVSIISLSWLLW